MARYTDRKGEWFEIWHEDKQSVYDTMVRNYNDDIDAGYDPQGACIQRQKAQCETYRDIIDATLEYFKNLTETEVDRWCFYDLVQRGAIA